jgi:hypothetical protein
MPPITSEEPTVRTEQGMNHCTRCHAWWTPSTLFINTLPWYPTTTMAGDGPVTYGHPRTFNDECPFCGTPRKDQP